MPSEFFYFLSRNADFISYATAHMNGSSGRQCVSGDDIGRYEVRLPSRKQISDLKKVLSWSMEVIRANSIENRNLALLRDTLLPKLISGEIDVSNVDLTQLTNNHLLTGEVHVFVRFCGIVCDVDAVSLCASWLYFCFNLRDTLNMTHDSKQRRLT